MADSMVGAEVSEDLQDDSDAVLIVVCTLAGETTKMSWARSSRVQDLRRVTHSAYASMLACWCTFHVPLC